MWAIPGDLLNIIFESAICCDTVLIEMPYAFDTQTTKIVKTRRNGAGGLVVPGNLWRSGVQDYRTSDGAKISLYRPPEEVFSAETIDSLTGVAVTIGHPENRVDASNWNVFSKGSATRYLKREKDAKTGEEFAVGELVINDLEAIRRVEGKDLSELSMGYDYELDMTPGIAPDGTPYQGIQRNIRQNHVALLASGEARAGRRAKLLMDASSACANIDTKQDKEARMLINIDGHQIDVADSSASSLKTLIEARDAQLKKVQDQLAAKDSELADSGTKLLKLQGECDSLKKLAAPETVAAVADEIIKMRTQAAEVLGKDYAFDGKSELEIIDAQIEALGATCDAEGVELRSAYLKGLLSAKPAKGSGKTYVGEEHANDKQDGLTGMSAVAARVQKKLSEGAN